MKMRKPLLLLALASAFTLTLITGQFVAFGTTESQELPDFSQGQDVSKSTSSIVSAARFNISKEPALAANLNNNRALAETSYVVSDEYFAETPNETVGVSEVANAKEDQVTNTLRDNANSITQAKRPEVVGREILAMEAQGLRNMDKKVLRKWRLESILPK